MSKAPDHWTYVPDGWPDRLYEAGCEAAVEAVEADPDGEATLFRVWQGLTGHDPDADVDTVAVVREAGVEIAPPFCPAEDCTGYCADWSVGFAHQYIDLARELWADTDRHYQEGTDR